MDDQYDDGQERGDEPPAYPPDPSCYICGGCCYVYNADWQRIPCYGCQGGGRTIRIATMAEACGHDRSVA